MKAASSTCVDFVALDNISMMIYINAQLDSARHVIFARRSARTQLEAA